MIQELLGSGQMGETKISNSGGGASFSVSSSSSSSSSSLATAIMPTNSATAICDQNQNLRCPRCDSSNTKFCYYNNYNLTQPRHFCKTCRRYWTKGGALRNVPIGGGCRKNRSITTQTAVGTKCGGGGHGRAKIMAPPEMGKPGIFGGHGLDPCSPFQWASAPHGSHLLALLRTPQNPNPNSMVNHPLCGSTVVGSVGLDLSSWRSSCQQQQQQLLNGVTVVEAAQQNSGIQEMYQKIRSSNNYFQPSSTAALGHINDNATPLSAKSSAVESAPVGGLGGEPGYWNPVFPWSGLPSTSGAYPELTKLN